MREEIETYFSRKFCLTVEQAIKYKFPNIKGLEVEMDESGTCHIIFEETDYSEKEVTDYLQEMKKIPPHNHQTQLP